jgi:hypothetical protein
VRPTGCAPPDAFAPVPLVGQRPLLMIVGTRAITSWMSVEASPRYSPENLGKTA